MATTIISKAANGHSHDQGGYPPASISPPAINGEAELHEGGSFAERIALQATYQIDVCCDVLLDSAKSICEDTLQNAQRVRAMAVRVKQLNSVLISYLSQDSITVKDAYHVVYGEYLKEGGAA